jgi:hypothetical protein
MERDVVMRMRKDVSFGRRVVGFFEVIITFPLVVLAVSKVSLALEHSAWQNLAGIGSAVAVAGSIFLLDRLCVRWLHRKERDSL